MALADPATGGHPAPMDAEYQFRAFISYSHTDQEWAARLSEDLSENQVKAFLDRNSLRAGPRWEDQLQMQLRNSRHLIAVWSDAARESDWVQRELAEFLGIVSVSGATDRQIIFVVLQGEPTAETPTRTPRASERFRTSCGVKSSARW
jgi:hypothetical protein